MHKPSRVPEDAFSSESLDEYCERLAAAFESLRSRSITGGSDADAGDSLDEYLNRLNEAFARLADPLRNFDTPVAPPVPLTPAAHTARPSGESPLPPPQLIAEPETLPQLIPEPETPPPSSAARRARSSNASGRARVKTASGRKRSMSVTKRTRRAGESLRRTPKRRKGR